MNGVQFHFSVSFADLERLRGSERSFEQPKQINRGDPREFISDISANSLLTDVTYNGYSWMLFSLLTFLLSQPLKSSPTLATPEELQFLVFGFQEFTFKLTSCHHD